MKRFRSGDRIEQMYGDYVVYPPRPIWKVGVFVRYEDSLTAWVVIDDNCQNGFEHESGAFIEHLRPASAVDRLAWALRTT